MGSVVEHVDCPECKCEEATNDYYYKSGEEYVNCPRCGYSYSQTRKRNPKNENLYLGDGSEEEHYDIKEIKNDIAYCVKYDHTPMMSLGGILREDLEQFKKDSIKNRKEYQVKQIILTSQHKNGEWIKEKVFKDEN